MSRNGMALQFEVALNINKEGLTAYIHEKKKSLSEQPNTCFLIFFIRFDISIFTTFLKNACTYKLVPFKKFYVDVHCLNPLAAIVAKLH